MRAVLVPVKSFGQAKLRLAAVLDEPEREELARRLAARVLASTGTTPVSVACDDGNVADWATAQGAEVLFTRGLGLSGAVAAGVAHLFGEGFALVVVAHADLPFAEGLSTLGEAGSITLVPDRHLDGTNVIAVPSPARFAFSYGPGSFARHRAEGERLGLPLRVVHDERLSFDIDTPADLARFLADTPDDPIVGGLNVKLAPT